MDKLFRHVRLVHDPSWQLVSSRLTELWIDIDVVYRDNELEKYRLWYYSMLGLRWGESRTEIKFTSLRPETEIDSKYFGTWSSTTSQPHSALRFAKWRLNFPESSHGGSAINWLPSPNLPLQLSETCERSQLVDVPMRQVKADQTQHPERAHSKYGHLLQSHWQDRAPMYWWSAVEQVGAALYCGILSRARGR